MSTQCCLYQCYTHSGLPSSPKRYFRELHEGRLVVGPKSREIFGGLLLVAEVECGSGAEEADPGAIGFLCPMQSVGCYR